MTSVHRFDDVRVKNEVLQKYTVELYHDFLSMRHQINIKNYQDDEPGGIAFFKIYK